MAKMLKIAKTLPKTAKIATDGENRFSKQQEMLPKKVKITADGENRWQKSPPKMAKITAKNGVNS